MKIARHPSVQTSAVSGVVLAMALYMTDGKPVAWALVAVWAALTVVAIGQAARS